MVWPSNHRHLTLAPRLDPLPLRETEAQLWVLVPLQSYVSESGKRQNTISDQEQSSWELHCVQASLLN